MSERTLEPLDESRFESVLCVVAHPDDIEYGTSAAVARWTEEGKRVAYYLLTRGEAGIDGMDPVDAAPARADEERASASVVGVDTVEFLGFPDGVVEYGVELRRAIAAQQAGYFKDEITPVEIVAREITGGRPAPSAGGWAVS